MCLHMKISKSFSDADRVASFVNGIARLVIRFVSGLELRLLPVATFYWKLSQHAGTKDNYLPFSDDHRIVRLSLL